MVSFYAYLFIDLFIHSFIHLYLYLYVFLYTFNYLFNYLFIFWEFLTFGWVIESFHGGTPTSWKKLKKGPQFCCLLELPILDENVLMYVLTQPFSSNKYCLTTVIVRATNWYARRSVRTESTVRNIKLLGWGPWIHDPAI